MKMGGGRKGRKEKTSKLERVEYVAQHSCPRENGDMSLSCEVETHSGASVPSTQAVKPLPVHSFSPPIAAVGGFRFRPAA